MSDSDSAQTGDELKPGPAEETVVSLSQLILAPLDAIFKAQVHAARSFLNFVLQLSYPNTSPETRADPKAAAARDTSDPNSVYKIRFAQSVVDPTGKAPDRVQNVEVPVLALVPLRPLSVEEAEFDMALQVTYVGAHRQTRESARTAPPSASGENRDWYLVEDPISLRGNLAKNPSAQSTPDAPVVQVKIKVGPVATPSGLEKLLTLLTNSAQVIDQPKP